MSLELPHDASVRVLSVPMDGADAGKTAYEITGATADDVQREITKIVDYIDIRGGEAHFRTPMREGKHWRSVGATWLADTVCA